VTQYIKYKYGEEAMSIIKYQQVGAEKIYNCLFIENNKRYLLADEVGLGKTVTAANVIVKMCKKLSEKQNSIRIGYICANKALARENIRKLYMRIREVDCNIKINEKTAETLVLGFKDVFEQDTAKITAEQNDTKVTISIYAITPSTTVKMLSDGTARERAYAYHLILQDGSEDVFLEEVCKGKAKKGFKKEKIKAKEELNKPSYDNFKEKFSDKIKQLWEKEKKDIISRCIKESIKKINLRSEERVAKYIALLILEKIIDNPDLQIKITKQEIIKEKNDLKKNIEKYENIKMIDVDKFIEGKKS